MCVKTFNIGLAASGWPEFREPKSLENPYNLLLLEPGLLNNQREVKAWYLNNDKQIEQAEFLNEKRDGRSIVIYEDGRISLGLYS